MRLCRSEDKHAAALALAGFRNDLVYLMGPQAMPTHDDARRRRDGQSPHHSDRRKSRMACLSLTDSALNFWMTALASDAGNPLLVTLLAVVIRPSRPPVTVTEVCVAAEKCAWIAARRSLVRPSCRKNVLCPMPQRGVVRNSSRSACPWMIS